MMSSNACPNDKLAVFVIEDFGEVCREIVKDPQPFSLSFGVSLLRTIGCDL